VIEAPNRRNRRRRRLLRSLIVGAAVLLIALIGSALSLRAKYGAAGLARSLSQLEEKGFYTSIPESSIGSEQDHPTVFSRFASEFHYDADAEYSSSGSRFPRRIYPLISDDFSREWTNVQLSFVRAYIEENEAATKVLREAVNRPELSAQDLAVYRDMGKASWISCLLEWRGRAACELNDPAKLKDSIEILCKLAKRISQVKVDDSSTAEEDAFYYPLTYDDEFEAIAAHLVVAGIVSGTLDNDAAHEQLKRIPKSSPERALYKHIQTTVFQTQLYKAGQTQTKAMIAQELLDAVEQLSPDIETCWGAINQRRDHWRSIGTMLSVLPVRLVEGEFVDGMRHINRLYISLDEPMRRCLNYELERCLIATLLYRQKYGTVPKDVSALAPEFLDKPVNDPFTGGPLQCTSFNELLLVYSLGPNGLDEVAESTLQILRQQQSSKYDDIVVGVKLPKVPASRP
jgi:hypothetical protein